MGHAASMPEAADTSLAPGTGAPHGSRTLNRLQTFPGLAGFRRKSDPAPPTPSHPHLAAASAPLLQTAEALRRATGRGASENVQPSGPAVQQVTAPLTESAQAGPGSSTQSKGPSTEAISQQQGKS